jgi:hypothetical protein
MSDSSSARSTSGWDAVSLNSRTPRRPANNAACLRRVPALPAWPPGPKWPKRQSTTMVDNGVSRGRSADACGGSGPPQAGAMASKMPDGICGQSSARKPSPELRAGQRRLNL